MNAVLERRRAAVSDVWECSDELVIVGAGELVPIGGTDQFHPFRAHPEYRYLADDVTPGGVLAYDAQDGWELLLPEVTREDCVWLGGEPGGGGLDAWLHARAGRPVARLGAGGTDAARSHAISVARLSKDAEEVRRMRCAADASRAGFQAAFALARPGCTEHEIKVEIESAFLRAGACRQAFDTSVGAGRNAAVLHCTPGARPLREGDFCLIDAGAEYAGYASDVSRTFVVGGDPSPEQRDIHALVLSVQEAACARCLPGREYREIHIEACVELAQGLVDMGILRGRAESLVERDVHALFFPHGIGHMLGLCVHDVGGYAEGREKSARFGLKWLRLDRPLEQGHVVTIEPGLYFIDALLGDPARREEFADAVNWTRVDSLMTLGGVRIEDDVLVTADQPEILTSAIPKSITVP